jgi:hypothetical protein
MRRQNCFGQSHIHSRRIFKLTVNESLFAIAYVSSATQEMSASDLERLLQTAREHNLQENVTGVLLYADGNYAQYIEGPQPALDDVYELILSSKLHRDISTLTRGPIGAREFPGWAMAYTPADSRQLLELTVADWQTHSAVDAAVRPGLDLLRAIWAPKLSKALDESLS